jgi:hypothetical protein
LLAFCVCAKAGSTGIAIKPTSSQLDHPRMILFSSDIFRFIFCLPGTHDNSLLAEKVKDCMVRESEL